MQARETGEAYLILLRLEHETLADPIRITSDGVATEQTIKEQTSLPGGLYPINLINGPSWIGDSGPNTDLKGAIQFDGKDDYIQINNFSYSGTISALTVEVWIKAESDGTIISFDKDHYWALEVGGNVPSGRVGATFTTDTETVTSFYSNADVLDDEWHHIAFLWDDSGYATLYIDGVQDKIENFGFSSVIGTGTTRYGFIGTGSKATKQGGLTDGEYSKGDMTSYLGYGFS